MSQQPPVVKERVHGKPGMLDEEEEEALRSKHTAWGMAIQDILHPTRRVFSVPAFKTSCTRGKQEYYNPRMSPRVFSLCNHYHMGNCSFQVSCLDIHVDRAFTDAVRSVANENPCCAYHNDYYTRELLADSTWMKQQKYVVQYNGRKFRIPMERIAWTVGIEGVAKDSTGSRPVDADTICQKFQEGKCKLGKQCTKIHICREAAGTILGTTVAEVSSVAPDISKFQTEKPSSQATPGATPVSQQGGGQQQQPQQQQQQQQQAQSQIVDHGHHPQSRGHYGHHGGAGGDRNQQSHNNTMQQMVAQPQHIQQQHPPQQQQQPQQQQHLAQLQPQQPQPQPQQQYPMQQQAPMMMMPQQPQPQQMVMMPSSNTMQPQQMHMFPSMQAPGQAMFQQPTMYAQPQPQMVMAPMAQSMGQPGMTTMTAMPGTMAQPMFPGQAMFAPNTGGQMYAQPQMIQSGMMQPGTAMMHPGTAMMAQPGTGMMQPGMMQPGMMQQMFPGGGYVVYQ